MASARLLAVEALRVIREYMSLREIERRTGISRSVLGRYLSGGVPDEARARRLLDLFSEVAPRVAPHASKQGRSITAARLLAVAAALKALEDGVSVSYAVARHGSSHHAAAAAALAAGYMDAEVVYASSIEGLHVRAPQCTLHECEGRLFTVCSRAERGGALAVFVDGWSSCLDRLLVEHALALSGGEPVYLAGPECGVITGEPRVRCVWGR